MAPNLCLQHSPYTNQSQFRLLDQAGFYSKANFGWKHEFKIPGSTETKFLSRSRGTWMAQLVECPTLGFSSGHDLRVVGSSLSWAPFYLLVPYYLSGLTFSAAFPLNKVSLLSIPVALCTWL